LRVLKATKDGIMFVHELVKAKAHATPGAIAIQEGQRQVTYRELEERAALLARCLNRFDVPVGAPVGLFIPRSADLAIGALGILQAGAAYVPLDPSDPRQRVEMALRDSGCKFAVVQRGVIDRLPAGDWKTVLLDECESRGDRNEIVRTREIASDDLAYVIFTSGSTGRPKGVQITHANLLNLIDWHIRALNITSTDQATMQASPGFDAAVWELWPYLVAGATVHIVEDHLRADSRSLRDWIVATGITVSFLPTPVAESMIALEWPAETRLRFLLTGADVLRRFPASGLPFTLVNNYGPTECTVVTTSGAILPEDRPTGLPTIGRPIENVRVYVVDELFQQVPPGTPGELVIGGAGVGRGYINRSELSEERFPSDCFSCIEGARLYRTGDLARMEQDGQISFLGRLDQQIKIRGYRIEPGEIEAVMQRHPAIRSSIVVAGTTESGDTSLVAYVVINPDIPVSASDLRSSLLSCLPDYMVPSKFVKIAQLPLTASGKIDRLSLPAPSPGNVLEEDHFESPHSETESWLADFLIKMLGVPRIGRNDNFFRLGGHSLLGAQLIAKIQQRFGVELSLRSLFDHPTLSGIALEIAKAIQAKVDAMSEDEARDILHSLPGEIAV
jgi:amino acid adenylation domain-containing protein